MRVYVRVCVSAYACEGVKVGECVCEVVMVRASACEYVCECV